MAVVKEVVEEDAAEQKNSLSNIVNRKFLDSNHDSEGVIVHFTAEEDSVKLGRVVTVNCIEQTLNVCTVSALEVVENDPDTATKMAPDNCVEKTWDVVTAMDLEDCS